MLFKGRLYSLLLFVINVLFSQENELHCKDGVYCDPSVEGGLKTKGILINTERNSVKVNDSETGTELNTVAKIKLPLVLKDKLTVAVGFTYNRQRTNLNLLSNSIEEFRVFDNKPLESYTTNLYFIRPFKGNTYLTAKASIGKSGNVTDNPRDYLKYSFTVLYGTKRNKRTILGYGLSYWYSMGSSIPLPILYWNKTINERFGLELQLPLSVKLRYQTLNRKNVILLQEKVSGYRFNIQQPELMNDNLEIQTLDLNTQIVFERELYDFLWMSISAGVKTNLNYKINTDYKVRRGIVVGASLFVVPPKRFLK